MGIRDTINFITLNEQENPIKLDIWMGTWNGTVFHSTSNWKEMHTLQQTLQNEANLGGLGSNTVISYTAQTIQSCVIFLGKELANQTPSKSYF